MKERLPFIDWMKTLGMLVIIYGHTAGRGLIEFTPPFNPKQLGVAFFVFVMGFSLARETRPAWRTVYNRYFEMALFGWIGAVLVSLLMLAFTGDPAESNYLPLFLGVNVLFDFFPANPTTWFIGTYLHLLVLWALLVRGWTIPPWALLVVLALEIVIRALLLDYAGGYIAYTALTNWMGAFFFGLWIGQRTLTTPSGRSVALSSAILIAVVVAWPLLTTPLQIADTFPFRTFAGSTLWMSASVTALYAVYTLAVFQITRLFPDVRVVRMLARNTVIVFIVHMPLVFLITPTLYRWVPAGWPRVLMNLFLFFFCLSLLSDWIRGLVHPDRLRDRLAARLSRSWPIFRTNDPAPEKTRR